MKDNLYFDHASTTYIDEVVLEAMMPYLTSKFGNPSSSHHFGLQAKIALDDARELVAKILNCSPSEVIFCGSGTEANNLAILGVEKACLKSSQSHAHLITSTIEHSSVFNCCQVLESEGAQATYIKVDSKGIVSPEDIKNAIQDNTKLVSIIYANNEIGTIQPVKEIGNMCKEKDILFHTDACQSAGYLSLDTQELNVDLLTLNASKIYGPKGIGALFIKKGTPIKPLIHGGNQEFSLRSGTHDIAGIIGLARALQLVKEKQATENQRLKSLTDKLINGLLATIPGSALNGHREKRLPNNTNIQIPGVQGREMLLQLDEVGICCSTGSACSQKTFKPSRVLLALGLSEKKANSSLRLTIGKITVEKDIDYALKVIPAIIKKLQSNS